MSNQFPEKCKIADVRDVDTLRMTITGDIVVNLAAVHRDNVRDKSEYQRTNVDGAENLALVCEERGIDKIVFTRRLLFMGFVSQVRMKLAKSNPTNMGGLSLRLRRNSNVAKKGENSLIVVRPTVIFGEGNRGNVFNP